MRCITSSLLSGLDFGRTDFSRIFIFGPPNFFADFLAGFFLLIFVGKSAQKNPPGKSPGKSSKIYTTKSSDTFLQIGRGNFCEVCSDFRNAGIHGAVAVFIQITYTKSLSWLARLEKQKPAKTGVMQKTMS